MALYDPKEFPETEVKTNALMAELLAWARAKPASQTYNYCNPSNCAVAQFGLERGHNELVNLDADELNAVFAGLDDVANPVWGAFTFGAFARRLEKALAQ